MTATARRSAPLGRLREFERATAGHRSGGGVVIVGMHGCGRTTLARAVADDAEQHGRAVLWVTASPVLERVPFGVFASLLPTAAPETSTERIACVLTALRYHGGARPTTLIVDDIHLLDESSAEVVLQAIATRAVGLVATAVSGRKLTPSARRLVDDGFVDVVELERFDRDAIEQISAAMLGGPPASATAELLWRWSDGLPEALHEIVEIGRRTGAFRIANGSWWWDGPAPLVTSVPAHVGRRVDSLSDAALDAFDLIVLGDEVEVDVVERLVGSDPLLELERAELVESTLRDDLMTVRCSRSQLVPQRRSSMPMLRRRALARRLLDALPPPSTPSQIIRSASLHSYADQRTDARTLEQATSILRLSDPHGAHTLAAARHEASPTVATAADLIDSRIEIGDRAGARRLLAEASSMTATSSEARRLTEAAFAVALFADRDPQAAGRLLRARRQLGTERRTDLLLPRSLDALAALLTARPDRAHRLALEAVDVSASEACRLRAGVTIVAALLMRGLTTEARTAATSLLMTAERLTGVMPSALGMLRAEIAFVQLWRGELTAVPVADPLTGRWPAPPLAHGASDRSIDWSLMAGIVAHLRGDHAESVARLNEAVVQQQQGKGIFHAEASAWLVVALCDAGRTTDGMRALQNFPARHLAILPGLHEWASGVVASARGRTSEATELLGAAADSARAVGADLIEARYLIELAERCDDVGSIARLEELSRTLDAPLLTALCDGAIARLERDPAAMLAGTARLEALGLRGRAKAMARSAEAVAVGSGEDAMAREARRARRTLRSRPSATPGNRAGLSQRELEVAELAAGGMTDREIAARLVLSVRTIESHLASAYRKLAVSSRAELAPSLR